MYTGIQLYYFDEAGNKIGPIVTDNIEIVHDSNGYDEDNIIITEKNILIREFKIMQGSYSRMTTFSWDALYRL